MEGVQYLTSADIRNAFVDHIDSSPTNELSYATLWTILREQNKPIRGATEKRQRDAVWRALDGDPRIERSGPGVFRLKSST